MRRVRVLYTREYQFETEIHVPDSISDETLTINSVNNSVVNKESSDKEEEKLFAIATGLEHLAFRSKANNITIQKLKIIEHDAIKPNGKE